MIIDFHTHCFPDRIAARAIEKLSHAGSITPETDGTLNSLIASMDKNGIDRSVICNIATNTHQTDNVNAFATETLSVSDRVIPLGSVHPGSTESDIRSSLASLRKNDIGGIKIHPDYMLTEIDDPAFDPIFKALCDFDMFAVTHAGYDFISPDHIHATPAAIKRVLNKYPSLKLVAAHLGGNSMIDEVEAQLAGSIVYIDTALAARNGSDPEKVKHLLENHDPDRILFGSDMPWSNAAAEVEYIRELGLGTELCEKIFSVNALALLATVGYRGFPQ